MVIYRTQWLIRFNLNEEVDNLKIIFLTYNRISVKLNPIGSYWRLVSVGLDDVVGLSRRQAIISTNDDQFRGRILRHHSYLDDSKSLSQESVLCT